MSEGEWQARRIEHIDPQFVTLGELVISVQPTPEPEQSEKDRIWEAVKAAARR